MMGSENTTPANGPIKPGLTTKADIVNNWLPRYTGRPLAEFGESISYSPISPIISNFFQKCTAMPPS